MAVANGSEIDFGGVLTGITDINVGVAGTKVDLTHLASAKKEYAVGLPDHTITIEANRNNASLAVGNEESLKVRLGGSTDPDREDFGPWAAAVVSNERSGSVDSPIARSVEFALTRETAA